MYKKLLISASLASCLLLTGCATMFGDNDRTVTVRSAPPGAQVLLNGQVAGVTPLTVTVPQVSDNYITVQKAGYQTSTQYIPTQFQNIGWLNILIWPGFIVDAISGDMMKLSTHSVNVPLVKTAS
ncbi:MAG: hypothetical protein K0Q57_1231 [Gammaproteobacteria bacterium]|nr:hypothetical protein [Gammaproteobacteria bacterium]